MSKKMPPPPSLPPSGAGNRTPSDDFCLFHKGKLSDQVYTCPTCKTKYCLECAKKAKAEKKNCIKCKQFIIL